MFKKFLGVVSFIGMLLPLSAASGPNEIVVPGGFKTEKILEFNKLGDPTGLIVAPNGDLMVGSSLMKLYRVTPAGEVSTLARFQYVKEPGPQDVVFNTDGKFYFTQTDPSVSPGLYEYDIATGVFGRVTSESGWQLGYIVSDGLGHFYATASNPTHTPVWKGFVKLTDADQDGYFDVSKFKPSDAASGIAVHNGSIYLVEAGSFGHILRYSANGTQVGGPVATGLISPNDLIIDSPGNLFTLVSGGTFVEGNGLFIKTLLVKVSPSGTKETIVDDIRERAYLAIDPNNTIYISEFNRGAISKVDPNGVKSDLTQDTGISIGTEVAFDVFDRPYISSFRRNQLVRIDPGTKTYEAVSPYFGLSQTTIATDKNGDFYLSGTNFYSETAPLGSKNALLKIDPLTGTWEKLADYFWRTVRFDAFGRLIVSLSGIRNPSTGSYYPSDYMGIFDLQTKQFTPYLAGAVNSLNTRYLFDKNQNFYSRRGRGDGIVKVLIPMAPQTPPFPLNNPSLFIDFGDISEIRYFDILSDERLIIPLHDTGELAFGHPNGTWSIFASGFSRPGHIKIDKNGIVYVSDIDSGIHRIIGAEFVGPAVESRLRDLCAEIQQRVSNQGIANSFCQKINNTIRSMQKGQYNAAVNLLGAFLNEIQAQDSKKIFHEDAVHFGTIVQNVINGLNLL